MSEQSAYTEHHPRWYRPRTSTYWWLEKRAYFLFIHLTSHASPHPNPSRSVLSC